MLLQFTGIVRRPVPKKGAELGLRPPHFPLAHRGVGDPTLRLRNPSETPNDSKLRISPETTPVQPERYNHLVVSPSRDSTEREATYLVKRSRIEQIVDLSKARQVELFQAYFPRKLVRQLAMEVFTRHEGELGYPIEAFSSARLRRTIDADQVSYALEIKGPKTGPWRAKIARPELSVPIDQGRYCELLPRASRGFVDKTRFIVTGQVWTKARQFTEVEAHIDFIHGTGQTLKGNRIWRWKPNRADFSKVDIELPSTKLLRALRSGRHDFEFLKEDAVEITSLRRKDREMLSTRRMARNGVDRKTRKAIARLTAA